MSLRVTVVGYGKWCTVDAREWRAVDTTVDAAPYDAERQKNASGRACAGVRRPIENASRQAGGARECTPAMPEAGVHVLAGAEGERGLALWAELRIPAPHPTAVRLRDRSTKA